MTANVEQYIQFGIGKEKYAVRISEIHEIIKLQEITEVPNVMNYVRGVINLRGKIVPVLSLRCLFNIEMDAFTKLSRIIVINHEDDKVGIIVDQVNKVISFSDIQPPPDQVGRVNGAFFSNIGISPDGIVGILEMSQVLLKENDVNGYD